MALRFGCDFQIIQGTLNKHLPPETHWNYDVLGKYCPSIMWQGLAWGRGYSPGEPLWPCTAARFSFLKVRMWAWYIMWLLVRSTYRLHGLPAFEWDGCVPRYVYVGFHPAVLGQWVKTRTLLKQRGEFLWLPQKQAIGLCPPSWKEYVAPGPCRECSAPSGVFIFRWIQCWNTQINFVGEVLSGCLTAPKVTLVWNWFNSNPGPTGVPVPFYNCSYSLS